MVTRRTVVLIAVVAALAVCIRLHAFSVEWALVAIIVAFAGDGHATKPGLSQREDTVLSLSMAGLADKEIAATLGISIHTVRTYWDRIRNRVGKETRAEVIAEVSRRRSEDLALGEAEKRFAEAYGRRAELEEILGQAPVPVWASSRNGHIEYANEQFWHYLGSPGVEHLDDAAASALPAEFRGPTRDEAIAARLHNGIFEHEAPLRRYDGEFRWHLIREVPIYDDAGDVKLRVGVAVDIDELHRRESTSTARANRHRLAADISDTGIAYCDPSTGTCYSNGAYEDLTGSAASERPWTDAVHPGDRPLAAEQWAQAVHAGKPFVSGVRFLHADGSVTHAKVRALSFSGGGWILLADKVVPAQTGIGDGDQLTRLAVVLSDILGLDRGQPPERR